jgi:hypothetical protein
MKEKIINFLPKLIIPVGVLVLGLVLYNQFLSDFKNKILKLKFISPEYYNNWIKNLPEIDKRDLRNKRGKYYSRLSELFNDKYKKFLDAFKYDLALYEKEQNNKIVELLLILPMLFDENPAKFNNSFIWLKQNIVYKIQFSKLVSDCFIYGNIDILNELLNKGSKDFHKNLYNFLKNLKDVK